MKIFCDYTAAVGTSEGSATLAGGAKVWYCLYCNLEHPKKWKFGIADAPDIDILSEMNAAQPGIQVREGVFSSEMDERALIAFIKDQLSGYLKYRGDGI